MARRVSRPLDVWDPSGTLDLVTVSGDAGALNERLRGYTRRRLVDAGASRPSVHVVRGDPSEQTELMGSEKRTIADASVVRPARNEDLDELVEHTWAVAAEGRWIGVEVPFDRDARRARLEALSSGKSSTVLVVDTPTAAGPGMVGHISIEIAPYGVADIGMLIIVGWRGLGLGSLMLDAAVEWASAAGAHKMALEVWPHNVSAIELYRKAGFVEEGRKQRHYRRRSGDLGCRSHGTIFVVNVGQRNCPTLLSARCSSAIPCRRP